MQKTLIILLILICNISYSKIGFLNKAKIQYEKNNYDQAKLLFEKDIVFNPKSTESYLYLAKIYKKKQQFDEEEKNLKTVILLDPKNSQAYYLLALKQIRDGDFKLAEKNAVSFKKFCSIKCEKYQEIKKLIKKSKS